MAITLLYNTENLRSAATGIRQCASEHADAIDRLNNLVHTLPEVWEGKAERKFIEEFKNMAEMFQKFDASLDQFSLELEEAAERMEDADRSLKQKISSIG